MAISEFTPEVQAAWAIATAQANTAAAQLAAAAPALEAQKAEEKRLREAREKDTLEFLSEVAGNVASPPPPSPFSLGSSAEELRSSSGWGSPKREDPGVESEQESEAFVSQCESVKRSSVSPSSGGGVRLGGDDSSDREVELGEDDSSDGGIVLEGSELEGGAERKVKDKGKGKAKK